MDDISFIPAKNFTRGRRRDINLIVIHTVEAQEKKRIARNVANWFAGESAPRASAHYVIDKDEIIQCVKEEDTAWHAPGANANGIGLEHAGFARQTLYEWRDDYSRVMLARSTELCAKICDRYKIPIRWLSAPELKDGLSGITGHDAVTKAFKKSTHWDPGPHFPRDQYIEMVIEACPTMRLC